MAGRNLRRKRASSHQSDSDEEEDLVERTKETAQCALAAHSRKGGMKDNEVKKVLKDAILISEKQMKEVVGCKFHRDGDRLFVSYESKMPTAAAGQADVIGEARQGLLSAVIMFIHMSKNPVVRTDKVKEHSLWEFLEGLGVAQTTVHPVFGLPSKLIAPSNSAEFVAQGWLSFEKKRGDRGDAEEILYDLGPRAVAFIDPQDILETFCQVMGDKKEEWTEHVKLGSRKNQRQTSSRTNGVVTID